MSHWHPKFLSLKRTKVWHFIWVFTVCKITHLGVSSIQSVKKRLWLPAVKGLTSWLSFVMFNCVFVTFPCGILGQAWYLIVSIPDLCHLSYFTLIPMWL